MNRIPSCLLRIHLDRLVRTARNQPRSRLVKCRTEDTLWTVSCVNLQRISKAHRFGVEGTRLRDVLEVLERQTGSVVPHCQCPVVATREHDAFVVERKRVDDRFVA